MPKLLTDAQIAQFQRDGYVTPIRVLSTEQAGALRARLEAYEAGGGAARDGLRHKAHLLLTWLADLVRHERVLDAVEDLYGPDLLCWASSFFIKDAEAPAYVSWHQDSTYWGLSAPDVVTAWVALTDSNAANGAMQVIPGSHTRDQMPHRDTFAPDNLLSRGQEVAVDVDPSRAVRFDLRAGEMSLHHVRLVHGSPPNTSTRRRIGYAIRYMPTRVRQLHGADGASLVRGTDRYGHFEPEPRPAADLDPAAVAFHRASSERSSRILYRGADAPGAADPSAARG